MKVTAIAVGLGTLCIASTAGQVPVPTTPSFSGPVFVAAPGSVNRVAALELLRTIDLPLTMDSESRGRLPGHDWPKVGSYKTLVIVPGFDFSTDDSSDTGVELNRIRGLIAQARKANASILLLHLGGDRSRSNWRLSRIDDSNLLVAKAADYIVVAGSGNTDDFFTFQGGMRGIPVEAVGAMADARDALMRLFNVGARMSPGSVGSVLPSLSTRQTPDGSTFEFASLRGRWVALHFWATTSNEIVSLRAYQAKYGDRVQFVGVAVDSPDRQWKRTIKDLPANWRHIRNGTGDEDLAARFDVHILPLRLLIDPSGKVVGRFADRRETAIDLLRPEDPRFLGTFFTRLDELFRRP